MISKKAPNYRLIIGKIKSTASRSLKPKHDRLTEGELLSNDRRAVGFGRIQLGHVIDAIIVREGQLIAGGGERRAEREWGPNHQMEEGVLRRGVSEGVVGL